MPTIPAGSPTYKAILDLSVEHPLLNSQQIATLLQRDGTMVRAIMQSDGFLELRAKRIMERYGEKIVGIRGQILDAASDAIAAIKQRIADPNGDVAPETLLKAADFLMKFIARPVDDGNTKDPTHNQVNVTVALTAEQLLHAQQVRRDHINTLELPAQRALPSPTPGQKGGSSL
jgi:hypothetical protein